MVIGFGVSGFGFGVWLKCRVGGQGFSVQDSGFRVWGLEFGV